MLMQLPSGQPGTQEGASSLLLAQKQSARAAYSLGAFIPFSVKQE